MNSLIFFLIEDTQKSDFQNTAGPIIFRFFLIEMPKKVFLKVFNGNIDIMLPREG